MRHEFILPYPQTVNTYWRRRGNTYFVSKAGERYRRDNEWHPHSALGYRSPREYLRQRACNGLSDNRCLEI